MKEEEMSDGPKRVLILTSSGGQGLIHGSEAVKQALEIECDAQIKVLDFFEECGSIGGPLTELYNLLLRRSLRLNALYIKTLHLLRTDKWRPFQWSLMARFGALLAREEPDILILTSQYIVSFVGYYRRTRGLVPKTYVANIDPGTCCVPLWFDKHLDGHLLPTDEAAKAYHSYGLPADRALPAALAVRQSFLSINDTPREVLKRSFELPIGRFSVLFTGSREGYWGVLPMIRKVTRLDKVHCTVICGSNEGLAEKLRRLPAASRGCLKVVGWTDQVHRLMRAADMVVSKPGKQTMKEAMATHTPMISIAYPTVMEQEEGNLEVMKNRDILLEARDLEDMVSIITRFRDDPTLLESHREQIRQASKDVNPGLLAQTLLRHYLAS